MKTPDSHLKNLPLPKNFILGDSEAMKKVLSQVEKASPSQAPILLKGESGTGKELFARLIHQKSLRNQGPFVVVHCGAIQNHLMESEFFGHKQGSFTGAIADKKGLFELAHEGSFFLDELGALPAEIQPKLLRAVQEGKIRPIGSEEEISVNVRVISAASGDLSGKIREDLLHRLDVISIPLPPLRQRGGDIPLLIRHFLDQHNKKYKKNIELSKEAFNYLKLYDYPGNVRELENIIERACPLSTEGKIEKQDVQVRKEDKNPMIEIPEQGFHLDEVMDHIEKTVLIKAMERFQGNRLKTAKLLRITPRSLKHRIYKHRLTKI